MGVRFKLALSVFALAMSVTLQAQRITKEEYILKYKGIAIEQMEKYGIPASIKIAQGILESDSGNSRLAIEANNHFGIKCRSDWRGETISHNDDAQGECFRKYADAEESYLDHAEFLDNSARYDPLFKLAPKDYKAWANGLKEAGYATNPSYPQLLIKIIEENKLYLLDEGVNVTYDDIKREGQRVESKQGMPVINVDDYNVTIDRGSGMKMGYNNHIPYVFAREGDTFASIASAFGIKVSTLLKFNDMDAVVPLAEGDALYVRMKNKHSEDGNMLYVVGEGDTPHSISQRFGVRLKNLCRLNRIKPGYTLKAGEQIRLK